MNYDVARFTAVGRSNAHITSHKIIEVEDCGIRVDVPSRITGSKGGVFIPVTDTSDLAAGTFVDLVIDCTSYNGRISDFTFRYIGRTPSKFISK